MNDIIQNNLNIRYLKLHFILRFPEESYVYRHKPSALRGGLGNILIEKYCLRDRNCKKCDFKNDCLVQQILYGKFRIKPPSVTEGESIGYVIECEDYREVIPARGILRFQILLFGNTINYWRMIVEAFANLGEVGFCQDKAKYYLLEVTNTTGDFIFKHGKYYPREVIVHTVKEYVEYRLKKMNEEKSKDRRAVFFTNTNITYRDEMIKEMQGKPLMAAISRRIYFLNCFEGIETKPLLLEIPEIIDQEMKFGENRRYSSRTETAMFLKGIRGRVDFNEIDNDTYAIMLAGELVHIGKDTSFGSGRYTMVEQPEEERRAALMKKNKITLSLHE